MTEEQAETVAKLIVTDIMKIDGDRKADRLVLTVDSQPQRRLGGWSRAALTNRIAKNLARMRLKAPA